MGCIALRQRKATFPGVSFPSRVVRSIMEMASFNPESLAEVLILRLAKAAARSSTMTWSMVGTRHSERVICCDLSGRSSVFMGTRKGRACSYQRRAPEGTHEARGGGQHHPPCP